MVSLLHVVNGEDFFNIRIKNLINQDEIDQNQFLN